MTNKLAGAVHWTPPPPLPPSFVGLKPDDVKPHESDESMIFKVSPWLLKLTTLSQLKSFAWFNKWKLTSLSSWYTFFDSPAEKTYCQVTDIFHGCASFSKQLPWIIASHYPFNWFKLLIDNFWIFLVLIDTQF